MTRDNAAKQLTSRRRRHRGYDLIGGPFERPLKPTLRFDRPTRFAIIAGGATSLWAVIYVASGLF